MHCLSLFSQEKPSSVGSRFADKTSDIASWALDDSPRNSVEPEIQASASGSLKYEPPERDNSSFSPNKQDNRSDFSGLTARNKVSPENSQDNNTQSGASMRNLTPWALVNDSKEESEPKVSNKPQIDERANRFGSLLRNFQSGAKSKSLDKTESEKDRGVGKIKVASIFDRNDPLEEEEKQRKMSAASSMKNRKSGEWRSPNSPGKGDRFRMDSPSPRRSDDMDSPRRDDKSDHRRSRSLDDLDDRPPRDLEDRSPRGATGGGGDIRPHALRKMQWEEKMKSQPPPTQPKPKQVIYKCFFWFYLLHQKRKTPLESPFTDPPPYCTI